MSEARDGISITPDGRIVVRGPGLEVVLRLEIGELREMAATLDAVADRLEDEASDAATAALAKAGGRLQ